MGRAGEDRLRVIVYADRSVTVSSGELLHSIREKTQALVNRSFRAAHAASESDFCLRLLLECGELHQGVADSETRRNGCDEWTRLERRLCDLSLAAARVFLNGGSPAQPTHEAFSVLDALVALEGSLPQTTLTVKICEGFAYYALYPQAYALAAKELRRKTSPQTEFRVIGIRSIGTSLAPVVAASLDPRSSALYSVRPVGHPFSRSLKLGPELSRALVCNRENAHFCIVDEGPGLSGTSMNCVGDWLEERGVASERIHYFPSHRAELGPIASPEHRARWKSSSKVTIDFERLVDFRIIPGLDASAIELSAGKWRSHLFPDAEIPASLVHQEKRKYLTRDFRFAQFAGLGRSGEAKEKKARLLSEARLTPRLLEISNGFHFHTWVSDRVPFERASRGELLTALSRYLVLTQKELRIRAQTTIYELASITRTNLRELAPNVALRFEEYFSTEIHNSRLSRIAREAEPVHIDGRLHSWEWILSPSHGILKTDAIDHGFAHDYVGPQDIAWDVVGALVELGLSQGELGRLLRSLRDCAGKRISDEALEFHLFAYLTFQAAKHQLGAQFLRASEPNESAALFREASRYLELFNTCREPRDGSSAA